MIPPPVRGVYDITLLHREKALEQGTGSEAREYGQELVSGGW